MPNNWPNGPAMALINMIRARAMVYPNFPNANAVLQQLTTCEQTHSPTHVHPAAGVYDLAGHLSKLSMAERKSRHADEDVEWGVVLTFLDHPGGGGAE